MDESTVKVWLDTNVLIYALDQDSRFHIESFEILRMP